MARSFLACCSLWYHPGPFLGFHLSRWNWETGEYPAKCAGAMGGRRATLKRSAAMILVTKRVFCLQLIRCICDPKHQLRRMNFHRVVKPGTKISQVPDAAALLLSVNLYSTPHVTKAHMTRGKVTGTLVKPKFGGSVSLYLRTNRSSWWIVFLFLALLLLK